MLAYIAHAMDRVNPADKGYLDEFRHLVVRTLTSAGVTCFLPQRAWEIPTPGTFESKMDEAENMRRNAIRINMSVLSDCDMLVAISPRGFRSVGVPLEIITFGIAARGKPILLVAKSVEDVVSGFWHGQGVYYLYSREDKERSLWVLESPSLPEPIIAASVAEGIERFVSVAKCSG